MTRREIREHLIKLLYMRDFHDRGEYDEQFQSYLELYGDEKGKQISEEDRKMLSDRLLAIEEKLPEIDAKIVKATKGWKLDRIGKVELGILRLAVYEIAFDDEIPEKVSVNEAVELAKSFCGSQSSSFVNGVLAKMI